MVAEAVGANGVGVFLFAVFAVANVAELGDVGGAFGVDGDRGRRDEGGNRGVLDEEGVVDVVEVCELGVEGARGAGCADVVGFGVDVQRLQVEMGEFRHGCGCFLRFSRFGFGLLPSGYIPQFTSQSPPSSFSCNGQRAQ